MAKITLMHTQTFMTRFLRNNPTQNILPKIMNILKMKTWLLAGFCALSLLYACTDDEYNAGLEIHPKNELIGIGHDSSQTIMAYSYVNENTINISTGYTNMVLGYCNDPILGETTNNIISHIDKSDITSHFLEDIIIVDSVNLYIQMVSSDGDTTNNQNISIFELEHDADLLNLSGVDLYTETLFGYIKPTALVDGFEFKPYINWADTSDTDTSIITIPIRDEEFINRLSTDVVDHFDVTIDSVYDADSNLTINYDTTLYYNYNTDSLFKANVLNGIYIKSNKSSSQSLSVINCSGTNMQMYYRRFYTDTATGLQTHDTLSFFYSFDDQYKASIFYKEISNNFIYNELYTDIDGPNVKEDTVVAIKNNNGLYTQIVIDGIGNWEDSVNTVINKASILLEFNEPIDIINSFTQIPSVYIHRILDSELTYLAYHYDASGVAALAHRSTGTGYGYEIILTSEVQELYENKQWDEPIYLQVKSTSNISLPNRVILNSHLHDENPMQLMITYSKY